MSKLIHVALVCSVFSAVSASAQVPTPVTPPTPVAPPPAPLEPPPAPAEQVAPSTLVIIAPVEVPPAPTGSVAVQSAPPGPPAGVDPALNKNAEESLSTANSEPEPEADGGWSDIITLGGYVEAYYSHNFAKPENRVTNNRWLDERNDSFTLQTVAFDVAAKKGPVSAKVTMMFGPTADRWYFEGAQIPPSETNPTLTPGQYSNETWKNIQTAYVGYEAPVGNGVLIQAGLLPTQIGYEGAAAKDNWNFSRSNLFNYLPFFHLGARATYPVSDSWSLTGAIYNGTNQPLDLNKGKAASVQSAFVKDGFILNLLYMGGNDRPYGDAMGKPWRNTFDLVTQYDVLPRLSLALMFNAGFEKGNLGVENWTAAALYARVKATEWLYFAARGDGIHERVAKKDGEISPIFFGGGDHIASGTFTAELRPIEGVSLRLEYRHDDSDKDVPLFYKKGVDAMGLQNLSKSQNTITVGMIGWF